MQDKVSKVKPGVYQAIEAMCSLHEAIHEYGLSVNDLAEGLALAIDGPRQGEDGHDMAIIAMGMMMQALEVDKSRGRAATDGDDGK